MLALLAPSRAYEPFSESNIQIDQEDVRRDEAVNKRLDDEQKAQYKSCLESNKSIYEKNKRNPACFLFGKCEPTERCSPPRQR